MMLSYIPLQGLAQQSTFAYQRSAGTIGQYSGIALSFNNGLDDQPTAHAKDISENGAHFEVGIFEDFLQPVAFTGALLQQFALVTVQFPQFTDGLWGNETA